MQPVMMKINSFLFIFEQIRLTMNHSEQIKNLIEKAKALPYGDTKVGMLEEAVKLADLHGDEALGFETRSELISAATFSGKAHLSLIHFPWMVAKSRQDPEKFPARELHWKYKWVVGALAEYPTIPKDTILKTLDEMREEFKKAQYKERTSWEYVRIVHFDMGDQAEAAEAQAHFLASQPTTIVDRWFFNANCEACETNNLVSYYTQLGQLEKALEMAEPLLNNTQTCENVPKVTYSRLLLPVFACGDHERAMDLYMKSRWAIQGNRNFIHQQAQVLAFLALIGKFREGIEWYEKHAGFGEETFTPIEKLEYLKGAALFLKLLAGSEMAQTAIRLPKAHPLHDQPQPVAVAQLAEDALNRATEMVKAFDLRNGNTWVSDQMAHFLDYQRLATHPS